MVFPYYAIQRVGSPTLDFQVCRGRIIFYCQIVKLTSFLKNFYCPVTPLAQMKAPRQVLYQARTAPGARPAL
jgi:hypothetical protein